MALVLMTVIVPRYCLAIEFGGIGAQPALTEVYPDTRTWFNYTVQPGDYYSDVVEVINNTNEEQTITVYPADGISSTNGGFAVEQEVEDRDEVGKWITLSQTEVIIPPRNSVEIPFTVSVPDTDQLTVGDHTGGIMMQVVNTTPSTTQGIELSTRIGVRVYINVLGDVIQHLTVKNVSLAPLKENPRIMDAAFTIENTGDIHQDFELHYSIDSTPTWIRWVSRDLTLPADSNVTLQALRDDTTVYHDTFEKPWFGTITMQGELQYHTVDGDKSILIDPIQYTIFPEWYSIVFAIIVIIVSGLIFLVLVRRIKRT